MHVRRKYRNRLRRVRRGLTLIETAAATIIIGLACTALIRLSMTSTIHNSSAQKLSAGILLAENIREMMAGMAFNDTAYGVSTFGPESGETLATFNDVDDFNGFDSQTRNDLASGSPIGVIDANRKVITETVNGVEQVPNEWLNWRQHITVTPVKATDLATVETSTLSRTVVRIEVVISHRENGTWIPVTTLRWLKAR